MFTALPLILAVRFETKDLQSGELRLTLAPSDAYNLQQHLIEGYKVIAVTEGALASESDKPTFYYHLAKV